MCISSPPGERVLEFSGQSKVNFTTARRFFSVTNSQQLEIAAGRRCDVEHSRLVEKVKDFLESTGIMNHATSNRIFTTAGDKTEVNEGFEA